MNSMNIKIPNEFLACLAAGMLFAFSGVARSSVIINEDFSSGDLDGWNVISGTWDVVFFDVSNVAEATSENSRLQKGFSLSVVSAFAISFDYGWEWGVNDFTLQQGVKLLNNEGDGYFYTIRQAADGYKYELFTVTAGSASSLVVDGNAPSQEGGQPLTGASLTWDGSTLRGYQDGTLVISSSPGLQYGTFSQLILEQVGLNGHARFDNVILEVTLVPEPGSAAMSAFGFLALVIARRRFRSAAH